MKPYGFMLHVMPLPLKADWASIRRSIEGGADCVQTARVFAVSAKTLQQRARREGWLSPEKVQKTLESGSGAREAFLRLNPQNASVIEAVALTLQAKGELHRKIVFEKAHEAVKKAAMGPIVKWSDLAIADTIARKAAGLESGDSQVNIAVLPSGWPTGASEMGGYRGQSMDIDVIESAEGDGTLVPPPSDDFNE